VHDSLRIGFISLEDPNDMGVWSGIPYQVLNALKRQNVSIEMFSPLRRDFRYALLPFMVAARLAKKEVVLSHYQIGLRSMARQVMRKMKERPVDVILATTSIPITLLECSVPIIFYTDAVSHMMPGYYGGHWDRLSNAAVKRGMQQEEAALQCCTFGVYASNWAAAGARNLTQPEKIRVVPFGANMPVEHDLGVVRKWISERLERMSTECRLLFIGVDWERKGGDAAVETARLLNEMGVNTKLTVVGCLPDKKVPEFVEVLGFVSKKSAEGRRQLVELYRNATFFILPTRAEAAGIVFCEASAFGVPILTSKTGGVEDYVREGINGTCLPYESKPEAFAKFIHETLKDGDRYTGLSLGGFNEYTSRLNWDSAAASLVDLCQEAVRQSQLDPARQGTRNPGTGTSSVRETAQAFSAFHYERIMSQRRSETTAGIR